MEKERGSGIDGKRSVFSHKKGVINQIGLIGSESRIGANCIADNAHHILPPCRQGYFLAHAIGLKLNAIFNVGGLILLHLVQTRLDEDINGVVATNLNIMELVATHAVNINEEMPLGR